MALPGGFEERLDAFQRLLVLRCITPDKLVPAIRVRSVFSSHALRPTRTPHPSMLHQSYVLGALGQAYVEPQEFRLSAIFADSSPSVPLIFVLSFGSDPMADLLKFADEKTKQVWEKCWVVPTTTWEGLNSRHQKVLTY